MLAMPGPLLAHCLSTGQSSGSGTGCVCSKRHLRASQHPPILPQQKLSTTIPFEGFQNSVRFLTHSLNSNSTLSYFSETVLCQPPSYSLFSLSLRWCLLASTLLYLQLKSSRATHRRTERMTPTHLKDRRVTHSRASRRRISTTTQNTL